MPNDYNSTSTFSETDSRIYRGMNIEASDSQASPNVQFSFRINESPFEDDLRLLSLESSTTSKTILLVEKIMESIKSASLSEDDDYHQFGKEIEKLIEIYGLEAIAVIEKIIRLNKVSDELASEMIEAIGSDKSKSSADDRLSILSEYLHSKNTKLRYGAIYAIGKIGSRTALSLLKEAKEKEPIGSFVSILTYLVNKLEKKLEPEKINGVPTPLY